MNETDIIFKSEDSMWQMLATGEKTFDARRWEIDDPRILRLCKGHWAARNVPWPNSWQFDEPHVCFLNKKTGEILKMEFQGLNFTDFALGWCFLKLGVIVERKFTPREAIIFRDSIVWGPEV